MQAMLKTVEGTFRDGRIELLESAPQIKDGRVLVIFLPPSGRVRLDERGVSEAQAADLRFRLRTFAEDWDRPEMDAYDL